MGRVIIDLTPYISGEKKMFKKCDHKGCEENKDITKDYIICETQKFSPNNLSTGQAGFG